MASVMPVSELPELGAVLGRRPLKMLDGPLREDEAGKRAKLAEGLMNLDMMLRDVLIDSVSASRCCKG